MRGLNVLDRFRDKQYTLVVAGPGNGTPMKDSEIAEDLGGGARIRRSGHPGLNGIARVVTSSAAKGRSSPPTTSS